MALAPNNAAHDMSQVPPAVRRAAAEADRLLAEQQAAVKGEQPPTPGPVPTAPPAPTNPEPDRPQIPTPQEPNPEPGPQPTNPDPDKPGEQPRQLTPEEQRERSAEGRLAVARRELAAANEEIDNLRRLLSVMQAPAPVQAPSNEMMFQAEDLSEEELEQWGPDLVKVIDKRAKALIAPLEQQLRDRIASLNGAVEQQVQVTQLNTRQEMLRTLDNNTGIQSWREINKQPDFLDWLAKIDRRAGQQRHKMLIDAFEANDASRVAAFFEDFLQETGQAPAPQQVEPRPTAQPKPSLETFAAPGKAGRAAPAPSAPAEPETITRADIARFYGDVRAGKFKGREDEQKAYEAEIYHASAAGRIQ